MRNTTLIAITVLSAAATAPPAVRTPDLRAAVTEAAIQVVHETDFKPLCDPANGVYDWCPKCAGGPPRLYHTVQEFYDLCGGEEAPAPDDPSSSIRKGFWIVLIGVVAVGTAVWLLED